MKGAAIEVVELTAVNYVMLHLVWLRARNLSEGTIQQRQLCLARLRRFHGGACLMGMDSDDIAAFRDRRTRAGTPLAVQSQAAELAHLRGFYKWMLIEGHRADDPTVRVPRPKLPRRLPRPIPEADLRRAVEMAPDRVRPWLMLAAFAGLRACEIAPLRADDLWWHSTPPIIIVRRAKGGDEQAVPLAPTLAEELRRLPHRGWLFPHGTDRGRHVTPHVVSHLSNEHLHRLGIWSTLHSLRHRFGTQVYKASGHDLRQTQELLRHQSPVSTAIYTQIDPTEGAGVVAALPALRVAR